MSDWQFVAHADQVHGDGPHHVSTANTDAVLVRIGGELRAFQGLCPHQGALLGEGELVDGQLVCRNHRWCFDADTGERVGGPECLQRFPLREVEGRVELDLSRIEEVDPAAAVVGFGDLSGPSSWETMKASFAPGSTERIHLWWEEQAGKHGRTYAYEVGGMRIFASADPAVIADALRQRPSGFRRVENLRAVFEDLGALNVFVEEGDAWRPLRRLAVRGLTGRTLKDFFPTLERVTRELKQRWERAADEGRVVDLRDDLLRFTVDVTTTLTFGVDTNLVGDEESWLLDQLDGLLPLMGERAIALIPVWKVYKSRAARRIEQKADNVRAWVYELVGKIRQRQQELGDAFEPSNFLEAMVTARDAEGNLFDEETLFGNALIMLLAGEDTTANTMTWAVHLLLDNPDAEAELRRALDEVSDFDAVEHVVNETLRLKGPAPNLGLAANEDAVVGNLALGKDDMLLLLTRLASVDADNVTEPRQFRPGRWQDPRTASTLQRSGAFVPFGSGPRICPGRSLALLEMRMALSMLYRNFEVERVGASEEVEEVFGFAMLPRGVRVKFRRRK